MSVSPDYILLYRGDQPGEKGGKSADPHDQIAVFFRVFQGIQQRLIIGDVELDLVTSAGNKAFEQYRKFPAAVFILKHFRQKTHIDHRTIL